MFGLDDDLRLYFFQVEIFILGLDNLGLIFLSTEVKYKGRSAFIFLFFKDILINQTECWKFQIFAMLVKIERGITMIYVAWFGSMPMLQQQNNLVLVWILNKRPAASASAFFFFFWGENHIYVAFMLFQLFYYSILSF